MTATAENTMVLTTPKHPIPVLSGVVQGRTGALRPDVRVPVDTLVFHTEGAEKFMALSMEDRAGVMLKTQAEMKNAMGGMTLDEYLAERRREAKRDA